MGIPMIGSRIRGITELVGEDGGAIVDADDAQGMAEAMRRFARTELGPALPPSVAERMRDYSIENLLELHENLYCELTSGALQRK
jgi:glycosyltransferase involved in cell wall biosynthesis